MKTNQNNEKTVPTQEQIEAACRQSARHFWNWLTWSLVYYVVINLFLIAINWFTSPHYWWVLWVIAGWGISLLMIRFVVYFQRGWYVEENPGICV